MLTTPLEPNETARMETSATAPALDWQAARDELLERGCVVLPRLLAAPACGEVAGLYEREELFRSRIVMARHGFGRGEYKYFADPLPPPVASLRASAYAGLVPAADRCAELLGLERRFPPTHEAMRALCAEAGQTRPTPLLLRYGPGDYNCLHQDVYGELVFPIQVAVLLSRPGHEFEGGEFVLVEQRPRLQSRAEVVPLAQGDAVAFFVRERPVRGTRGIYRVAMRHGVSRVRRGARHVLGLIFHDAK